MQPDLSQNAHIWKLPFKFPESKFITEFKLTLLKPEIEFIENFNDDVAHMYLNPKVHKSKEIIDSIGQSKTSILIAREPQDLPFRPIRSGTRCPLSRLSSLVIDLIEPFLKQVPSYIHYTGFVGPFTEAT